MEALLDSIRIAISDGASDDERRRGLAACRAVADALGAGIVVGEVAATSVDGSAEPEPAVVAATTALALAVPNEPVVAPIANPLASNPFVGLTADQILDLAIARLRGAVGEEAAPPPVGQPFRLTLVPVPRFS